MIDINELENLASWFNNVQWRGGKGDPIKALFCRCDYKGIVKQYLTEKEQGSVYIKPVDVKKNTAIINGVEIEYLDKIYNNVRVGLSFKDRIKVLFGADIKVNTTIYTKNYTEVTGSDTIVDFYPIHVSPVNKNRKRLTVTNK